MRGRFTLVQAVVILGCVSFSPSRASAEEISIRGGVIDYSRQNMAEIRLSLTDPFTDGLGWIQGQFGNDSNESWNPSHACYQCAPGGTINPSVSEAFYRAGRENGVGVGGLMFVEGVTYELDEMVFTITAGNLVIPASLDVGFTRATRFLLRGTISGMDNGSVLGFNLLGVGNARVTFEGGNWFSTTYTFDDPSAVPEPGTMLLFGSGAAALAARWRRRRTLSSL